MNDVGSIQVPEHRWQPYLAERERPDQPVVMYQRWSELLFLHWRFDPAEVQSRLPPGLTVDTFDDAAWIGVVPFRMEAVRPRFLPTLPGLSAFPELNLRTYVRDESGRPGVWFFSLDTPQPIANWVARRFFHLNYRRARFSIRGSAGAYRYRSELRLPGGWDEAQDYKWSREQSPQTAATGSLEFFLVERYRLFAFDGHRSRLLSGRVYHPPYTLETVDLEAHSTRLFPSNGLEPPARPPDHAVASPGVEVQVFPLGSCTAL